MPEQFPLLNKIIDMLLNSTLLGNLPPAEVLSVARYFSLSQIEQGDVIFNEGDMGTFMCLIVKGNVSVQKFNQNGNNIELAKLPKGLTFGEMAVLDGERRSARCIAATDCTLLILSKDSLEKMILESPTIAAKVIRAIAISLSNRLRMSNGKLVNYLA